jgi:hypothetical protein
MGGVAAVDVRTAPTQMQRERGHARLGQCSGMTPEESAISLARDR